MIPKFSECMLPVLKHIKANGSCRMSDLVDYIKVQFEVSEEESVQTISSGQTLIYSRVAWAVTYLRQSDLIESKARGVYSLTKEGQKLAKSDSPITVKLLKQYESFNHFIKGNTVQDNSSQNPIDDSDPVSIVEQYANVIEDSLVSKLLDAINGMKPVFLEHLVVDLLLKMGYAYDKDSVTVTKLSMDGGIDGIVSEDKLGLDRIYVQAKRFRKGNNVQTDDLDKFLGSLTKFGAKKGVFITTSDFSAHAKEYSPKSDIKIILINGIQLCRYMVKYNLGVFLQKTIEIKEIDENYFTESLKETKNQ